VKNSKKTVDPVKEGTPGESALHDGLFNSPDEAKLIIKAVKNFLQRSSGSADDASAHALLGFAIEETEVEFSKDVRRVKMKTKYAAGKLQLVAPMKEGESEQVLKVCEAQLLAEFSTRIFEGQLRASMQFYRTLNAEGREVLLEKYGDQKIEQ